MTSRRRRLASVWDLLRTLAGLPFVIIVMLIEGLINAATSALDNC